MKHKPGASDPQQQRWTVPPRCLAVLVLCLGLAMRAARPAAMAVEHFDEGVYASNLYSGHLEPAFAYPLRHLYAPPLFPSLLEWALILSGGRPASVMWINVLAGSITVAAVWWITSRWFGSAAALAGAVLAATSEYHIAFSRMALTDVCLSLWMLLGVYAGWRAVLTGRPVWLVAAGLLAGCAWCTKYNGWLTLAITGAGSAAWVLSQTGPIRRALARAGLGPDSNEWHTVSASVVAARWGVTVAVAAFIFWLVVLRDLQTLGGYAAVARNHAGYFAGWSGWWSGLVRQFFAHDHVMGGVTWLGMGAAVASAGLATRALAERSVHRTWMPLYGAVVVALLAALLSASGVLAIGAVAGIVVLLRRPGVGGAGAAEGESDSGERLATWMLAAWFAGLLIATPLYFPYPRLSVPWLVACWPLAAAAAARFIGRAAQATTTDVRDKRIEGAPPPHRPSTPHVPSEGAGAPAHSTRRLLTGAALIGLLLVLVVVRHDRFSDGLAVPAAWQRRTSRQEVSRQVRNRIAARLSESAVVSAEGVRAIVNVHGDPAVYFHLSALSDQSDRSLVVLPVAEPRTGRAAAAGPPEFLITAAGPQDLPSELVPRGHWTFRPSDLVLLDEFPAARLRETGSRLLSDLWLYEVPAER